MKIEILEITNDNISKLIEIDSKRESIKNLKNSISKFNGFKIDYNVLNLGQKLYGNSKAESIKIQKSNCKLLLKLYKRLIKAIKILLKNNIEFDGKIYVDNLSNKKNNNDFLLQSLLNLKFDIKKKKLESVISFSCDYLSKENTLNNMCDFKDNRCIDCRERNIDRSIGCCQKNCKFTHTGVCNVKNISCKLYMCDGLEKRGYYFSPMYLPILKKYLTPIQRFVCICMLFKPLDFQVKCLKWVNIVSVFILLLILFFVFIQFI